jgi:large subunit ribosomal protein L10
MPSQKNITQVSDLTQKLQTAKSAAFVQYQGLNAAEIAALRANIKEKGGSMEVAKNSLITLALKNMGIDLPETLTGPTAVTFSHEDEIAPLKEIEKVAKNKEVIEFKYGFFENKLLSVDDLKRLLNLPSRSALIAQFVGGLQNPLQRLAYALRFNQTQFVLTLKALAEKQGQ